MTRLGSIMARLLPRASPASSQEPALHVAEITPCVPRAGAVRSGNRLNLILPSINREHYFGGIHTALLAHRELSRWFPESRIVLLDAEPDDEALARFADHLVVPAGEDSPSPMQIVPFSDRYGKTLPVAPEDHWLSTAWWTAYAGQRLALWQSGHQHVQRPIVYLIQDYEPGFYPWSSQYALALGTYRPDSDIALFNTALLADFFAGQGLDYRHAYVFEPELNAGLRTALEQLPDASIRQRQVVVYARPGTPRNAFELICEGLRLWGWRDARSATWSFVAAGELEADVDLGPVRLRALGKLGIDAYGALLATSAIGVSLMVSPHPSYPPLEMAAFGMSVLTNRHANKDLGAVLPNVHSLADMSPEAICTGLTHLVDTLEARGMRANPAYGQEASLLRIGGLATAAAAAATAWGVS